MGELKRIRKRQRALLAQLPPKFKATVQSSVDATNIPVDADDDRRIAEKVLRSEADIHADALEKLVSEYQKMVLGRVAKIVTEVKSPNPLSDAVKPFAMDADRLQEYDGKFWSRQRNPAAWDALILLLLAEKLAPAPKSEG